MKEPEETQPAATGMPPREQLEMMRRCQGEIRELRATIERLKPKADAYDNMSTMLNAIVRQPGQGMGEDLNWTLERRIREIEAQISADEARQKSEAQQFKNARESLEAKIAALKSGEAT